MAQTHGCVIDSDNPADSSNSTPDFPWPPRENASVLDSLAATWKDSVFHPASFFSRMPREFDLGWVIGYYVLISVVAAGISLFWEMVIGPSLLERMLPDESRSGNGLVDFLLSPLIATAALFIGAGIVHLFLMLFRGNKYGFGASLRVFCFSSSPQLFEIVPFLGALVGGVWALVLTVIGLRETHETTTGKSVAAVLVPMFFLIVLTGLLMFAAFVVGATKLGS